MSKSDEPEGRQCYFCNAPMTKKQRIETEKLTRVLWQCTKCGEDYWKMYGEIESDRRRRDTGGPDSHRLA